MTRTLPQETGVQPRAATGYLVPLAILLVGTLVFVLFVNPGPLGPGGSGIAVSGEDPGPLTAGDATVVGAKQQPGDLITFGHVAVFNTGRATAVLDHVGFEPPLPDNLQLLGIQVASDPDREIHTIGAVDGYPPMYPEIGRLHPLRGAKVFSESTPEGDRGVPLIMGFRFEGGDVASFRYVYVDYRVNGRKYRAKLDKTFIVCSATAYPDGCPEQEELYPEE